MNNLQDEKEVKAIKTFLQFLHKEDLLSPQEKLDYENADLEVVMETKFKTLFDCIQNYFHYFQEDTLKKLITVALEYRNQQVEKQKANAAVVIKDEDLLGEWSVIIDTMKLILQQRRDLAGSHFQQLIQYGQEGKPETVDFYLKELFHNGFIDHLFLSILEDTISTLARNKNTSNDENYFMLTYFMQTIMNLRKEQEEIRQNNLENSKTLVKKEAAKKIATTPSPVHSTKQPVIVDNTEFKEEELVYYSHLLNNLIKESSGNISVLQDKLIQQIEKPTHTLQNPFPFELFLFVIQENINACLKANYQNKLKLLQFLEKFLKNYIVKLKEKKSSLENALSHSDLEKTAATMSTYHAPKFIDQQNGSQSGKMNKTILYQPLFSAQHLIFNENASFISSTVAIPTNNKKKKAFRKEMKNKKNAFLEKTNSFLVENGWVIIDDFFPLELVKRIRIESNLFRHFYDQAEIWVGKKADIGAHLTVPSVRGDRVLWVCGGHNVLNNNDTTDNESDTEDGESNKLVKGHKPTHSAPEGVSRMIKTIGDIEPCKIEVKASAPIRKFSALKDAITSMDYLVEEFKHFKSESHPNHLSPIYERSDGMLSIYPGEGARFANHVDNTTKDGRILTVITYLNPSWTEEMGGCLRLRPKRHNHSPASVGKNGEVMKNDEGLEGNVPKNLEKAVKSSNTTSSPASHPNFADYDGIDILPLAGRAILFYSSQMEHEVLPTFGDRHALTIWYYDKNERKEAIERAKEEGITEKVSQTSQTTQQEAKAFIADLMGGSDIPEDGGNPTEEELQLLTRKVSSLSDDALEIVSSITGAPSVESFRAGFPMLTVQDLKSMRALFCRMGIQ
jgi:Rps23 Pro-64 3,4-dihydroxylase Tpa1-like proline 4-hydroxylase